MKEIKKRNRLVVSRYSGPTAAHAYHHIQQLDHITRVFILGPSHHFYLKWVSEKAICLKLFSSSHNHTKTLFHVSFTRGCAISSATEYETPFGNIPIDSEVNEQLMNTVRLFLSLPLPLRRSKGATDWFVFCLSDYKKPGKIRDNGFTCRWRWAQYWNAFAIYPQSHERQIFQSCSDSRGDNKSKSRCRVRTPFGSVFWRSL